MPKIDNESDLEYKKRVIDPKSTSFCAAKWYNATIWLGSGMTTSCHHPLPHKVEEQEIKFNPKALHNTAEKKKDRLMMQRGERPAGCEYCWKIEDMGRDAISDRVYKTIIYEDTDLDEAFNTRSERDVNLQTLEIAFDRTCQFACSYCNPAFSTSWVRDIHRNGTYTGLVSDGRNHFTHEHSSSQLYGINEKNPYAEAFFEWWDTDLHKTLKELRITGGEPLMSGYTWRLIDWFKEHRGASKTRLAINSNLGYERVVLERMLESTSGIELDIYTSNESMPSHAEYIRDGLEWRQWADNMEYLLGNSDVRELHVMCTINALCLSSLTEFLQFLIDLKKIYGKGRLSFTLNILRFPSFQSPLVLPSDIRTLYKNRLEVFYDQNLDNLLLHQHELNHIQRLIDYLDVVKTPHSEAFDMISLHNDFKQFYTQYDARRGKNFNETFPNIITDWYNTL
jgi:organic radical activating enzyme